LRKIFANLRQVFPVTMGYWGVIPTYPGQMWTWGFCSKGVTPFEHVTREKVAAISKNARYYNYDVHVGAFALPNFVAELVKPQTPALASV
jgi:spermidine synthase